MGLTGPITWEAIVTIVALAGSVGGAWLRFEMAISAARAKSASDIAAVEKELTDFKVEVAREYARNGYIKDVEQRLIDRLSSLDGKIDRLLVAKGA